MAKTNKINRKNLLRMAEYIENIPQDRFDMGAYRSNMLDKTKHACGTIGCVIGHCTVLDDIENIPTLASSLGVKPNTIDFSGWSESFTGLRHFSHGWSWCFGGEWADVDNTPKGASDRIKYFVKHGVPKNYKKQMKGRYPLVYKRPENWIWRLRFTWNMFFNYKRN